MLTKIKETAQFLQAKLNIIPEIGIILGTGLGGLAEVIENKQEIEYHQIPNFPVSYVKGHSNKLIFGQISGKNVVAMQGRFHYYEGYDMYEVSFPVRVFKLLGIELLIISNACGAVNPEFEVGDLMIITDHINLFPGNPLRGKNIDELGTRFPDMSEPYSKSLINKAENIAFNNKINIRKGVYAAMSGPAFETPAEYKFLEIIGADVIGMSTIPENIVARHMKIPVFAISVITDSGAPGKIKEISHEEVHEAALKAEKKLTLLVKELILYNS